MGEEGREEFESGGYYSTTGDFIEAPKKQLFRIQIPSALRFAVIWTIFFAVIGIAIQSIRYDYFVFGEFFTSNFAEWFRSFGTFTDAIIFPTGMDIVYALLRDWYYFFYTGGLISLLWGIVSLIIHGEIVFKRPETKPKPRKSKK